MLTVVYTATAGYVSVHAMLTRLRVDGFKNLAGIDVRFGPLTCLAGPNGVGKSNLFDAIQFLSALAEKPVLEAAATVRGGEARRGDVRGLFRRVGDEVADRMSFEVEMVIPPTGEDELGQAAKASTTFLRYRLELARRKNGSPEAVQVVCEEMTHIHRKDARSSLPFPHSPEWRNSVVVGRRKAAYISTETRKATEGEKQLRVVSIHADSTGERGGGRPRPVPAHGLPRTMLSSVNNAAEHRTLVLARQEMMGWTHLQLEPSALRAPDDFTAPRRIGPNGAHLPKTLYELALARERAEQGGSENVRAQVANRLSELVENVRSVGVDVDERRQLLSIVMKDRHGTEHVASALSDGTLRFLALAVMEVDPLSRPLLCLEEPENGIHPSRIEAALRLLADLAVDTHLPVDSENPLRQVIINTHSPSVVACLPDDALLVADARLVVRDGKEESRLSLRHLPETWREKAQPNQPTATRGDLLEYLNPFSSFEPPPSESKSGRRRRVVERKELTGLLPWPRTNRSAK